MPSKPESLQLFAWLKARWPKLPADKATIEAWHEEWQNFALSDLQEACREHFRNAMRLPEPKAPEIIQLLALVHGILDRREEKVRRERKEIEQQSDPLVQAAGGQKLKAILALLDKKTTLEEVLKFIDKTDRELRLSKLH